MLTSWVVLGMRDECNWCSGCGRLEVRREVMVVIVVGLPKQHHPLLFGALKRRQYVCFFELIKDFNNIKLNVP